MAERGLPRPAPGPNRTHPRGRCRHNTRHLPARGARSPIHHPQRPPDLRTPAQSGLPHPATHTEEPAASPRIRTWSPTLRSRRPCPMRRHPWRHAPTASIRQAVPQRVERQGPATHPPARRCSDLATPTRPAAGTRRGRDDRHAAHHDSEDPHGIPPGEGPRARLFAAEMALQPFAYWPGRGRGCGCRRQRHRWGRGAWPSGADAQRSQPFELSDVPAKMAHARAVVSASSRIAAAR